VNEVPSPREPRGDDAGLLRLFEAIGAHRDPQRKAQERDRARQRAVVGIVLPAWWLANLAFGLPIGPPIWFVALGLTYGLSSLVYLRRSIAWKSERPHSSMPTCCSIRLPGRGPLLRSGDLRLPQSLPARRHRPHRHSLRHPDDAGVVGDDLAASLLLLASPYWRSNVELGLAYLLMIVFGRSSSPPSSAASIPFAPSRKNAPACSPRTSSPSRAAPSSPRSATSCARRCRASSPRST
jgi:hypothetical protein